MRKRKRTTAIFQHGAHCSEDDSLDLDDKISCWGLGATVSLRASLPCLSLSEERVCLGRLTASMLRSSGSRREMIPVGPCRDQIQHEWMVKRY